MSVFKGSWTNLSATILLAGVLTTSLTGCDDDVATGVAIGGVVGAVVGGIISDDYYDDYPDRHRYRPRYPRYYPYSGGEPTLELETDSRLLADRFDISVQSAQIILTHVDSAQVGNTQAMQEIGLQPEDLVDLAQLQMPNQQTVGQFAQRVNVEQNQAEQILQAVVDQAQMQFQDTNSPLWQSCISANKWKTPQNLYCKETYWNGCSPSTGATSCIPAE